jgi:hypothetical protein
MPSVGDAFGLPKRQQQELGLGCSLRFQGRLARFDVFSICARALGNVKPSSEYLCGRTTFEITLELRYVIRLVMNRADLIVPR